jgi:hypothetical protein
MIIKLNAVKIIYTKVSYNKIRHFNNHVLQIHKMIKWLRECTRCQNDYKLLSLTNHPISLLDFVFDVQNYTNSKELRGGWHVAIIHQLFCYHPYLKTSHLA